MKAILEFDLPEDQEQHQAAVDGQKWKSALFELDRQLRAIEKHGSNNLSATEYRDKIREIMYESGLMFE